MKASHPLADWLAEKGQTRVEFARLIDISEPHLSLILARKRRASLDVAVRVENATGGKVTARDVAEAVTK